MRWARRILLGVLGLIVLALLAGVVYEAVSRASDEKRFRPPGQLVDVGGHRIHIHCTGSGSPTVVLEAGLGLTALLWRAVQPGIAAFTTVCSYDRAGYGYSDPGPLPRTVERRVDDLRAALRGAGRPPPYVLVGHSAGGLAARSFQHRFPGEVVGVVLVDSSHEDQFVRAPPSLAAGMRAEGSQAEVAAALQPLGVTRLLLAFIARQAGVPQDLADEYVALSVRRPYLEAVRSETDQLLGRKDVPPGVTLGELPLVVLTAGKAGELDLPPADAAAFRRLWVEELQPELARLSSRSRQVTVEGSGHLIPMEEPGAVVEAVRQVVDEIRARRD